MSASEKFSDTPRRPRPALIALIVLLHLLAIYGLGRAFAPNLTQQVERTVVSAFSVTITAPEEEPNPEPDEGAAGDAGEKATPKPVTAPKARVKQDQPMPRASSTGAADTSGVRDAGDGTGAAGEGSGTGSGNQGGGMGGGLASGPSVRSGEVNSAKDFPVPDGGRETRFGKSVTVVFTVTRDGYARNCSVARSSADPATTALVCPLVIEKVRFNPARNRNGDPVEARYGYRVDFRAR